MTLRTHVPLFRKKWAFFQTFGHVIRYFAFRGLIFLFFWQIAEYLSEKIVK